jgi:hypothetical protein
VSHRQFALGRGRVELERGSQDPAVDLVDRVVLRFETARTGKISGSERDQRVAELSACDTDHLHQLMGGAGTVRHVGDDVGELLGDQAQLVGDQDVVVGNSASTSRGSPAIGAWRAAQLGNVAHDHFGVIVVKIFELFADEVQHLGCVTDHRLQALLDIGKFVCERLAHDHSAVSARSNVVTSSTPSSSVRSSVSRWTLGWP